jgi:hypothetical protein
VIRKYALLAIECQLLQFDSNLAKIKSTFNEICQVGKVIDAKHEYCCNAAMVNSHTAVSTRKGFNYGFCLVWFVVSEK